MPADHPMWADILVRVFRKESPAALAVWLAELPIFAGFPHRENLHIARLIHRREYAPGETVFKQGDIGSGMYLIESGAVRIVGEDIRHGEVQYAILRAGQSFGEMSLFDNAPRSASAVAAEETVLYGLFEGDLDQLERTRPHVACKLLRNLGQLVAVRLRHTNDRLREIEDSRLSSRNAAV